jgi:DNA-binding XRE family transcriptional regulator
LRGAKKTKVFWFFFQKRTLSFLFNYLGSPLQSRVTCICKFRAVFVSFLSASLLGPPMPSTDTTRRRRELAPWIDLSADQCRAARRLLGWTQNDLAAASGVCRKTIGNFERGACAPYPSSLKALREALQSAGVTFATSRKKHGIACLEA